MPYKSSIFELPLKESHMPVYRPKVPPQLEVGQKKNVLESLQLAFSCLFLPTVPMCYSIKVRNSGPNDYWQHSSYSANILRIWLVHVFFSAKLWFVLVGGANRVQLASG